MNFKTIALGLAALMLAGCSSITMPKAELAEHDAIRTIPKVDDMIVGLKREYIDKCYAPIVHKNPPENACQTELFQQLERRYHTDYDQAQVNMASDDLFFKDVNSRLRQMMRSDPEVRNAISRAIQAKAFSNSEDVLAYYKSKYSFTNQ